MEKHNMYYVILESFKFNECPLCYYINLTVEKYYDIILYEGVNDFGFIEKFRNNIGFCNYHSYKLLEYRNSLSTASIYKYIYNDLLNNLKNNFYKIKNFKNFKCDICELIIDNENFYISSLLNYLEDNKLKESYLNSEGFCIPHLIDIINYKGKKIPNWIIDYQYKKFDNIFNLIKKYIDSKNYSLGENRPSLSYEEQLIYKKAVKLLIGFEGKK